MASVCETGNGQTGQRVAQNRLLQALLPRDSEAVLVECEAVRLGIGQILYEAEQRIGHVYFPTGSFISLLIAVDPTAKLEVALVGNEGMLGLPLLLGANLWPNRALVQGPGPAWRMSAATFTRLIGRRPALRRLLHRYLQVRMKQLAQATACARFHVVEQRLARQLLMMQDRVGGDDFHVTHESLASMLGVRRVGITKAANDLQKRRLMRYHRGDVTIGDRDGMEAVSCACYRADRDAYESLLSPAQ